MRSLSLIADHASALVARRSLRQGASHDPLRRLQLPSRTCVRGLGLRFLGEAAAGLSGLVSADLCLLQVFIHFWLVWACLCTLGSEPSPPHPRLQAVASRAFCSGVKSRMQ